MKIIKLAISIAALAFSGSAFAGAMCSADITDGISPNGGCEVGSTNNDKQNPMQVNLDEMFGPADWVFGGKYFEGSNETSIGLKLGGDTIGGEFKLKDVWGVFDEIMLVIKGAKSFNYVGYLLESGQTSGEYLTPFREVGKNGIKYKDISHITVYTRGKGSTVTVPEPGTLLLLGTGMMLIGMRRRRQI